MKAYGSAQDPLWFKDAIIYELHVRAFYDSNAMGWAIFRGLTQRLDYLQDLGVTAIWLLAVFSIAAADDGYDIADYLTFIPTTARLRIFEHFLRRAHRRGTCRSSPSS